MRRLTQEEFIERLHILNPTVEVKGYEWSPQAGSLLAKHGCPICAKINRSKAR